MHRVLVLLSAAALVATSACSSPQPVPDAAAPGGGPPTATAGPHGGETLVGTLTYTPVAPRMSVEAYLGEEFFLTVPGDETPRVLRASESVTEAQLQALAGQRVSVTVSWTDGTLPPADSAYPMGPDGQPLRQGAGWRVLTLSAAPAP